MKKNSDPQLTDEQKDVLFHRATELPFSGELLYNEEDGDYVCANCAQVLFGAETKFDSGSGWLSFYDVKSPEAVRLVEDTSQAMHRIEIQCSRCEAHMGHVFNDAVDQPTTLRFSANSLALKFEAK